MVEQPVVPQGTSPGRGPENRSAHDAAPALRFAPACPGRPGFAVRPN